MRDNNNNEECIMKVKGLTHGGPKCRRSMSFITIACVRACVHAATHPKFDGSKGNLDFSSSLKA